MQHASFGAWLAEVDELTSEQRWEMDVVLASYGGI